MKDKQIALWGTLFSGAFLTVALCVYGGLLYQYSTTEPLLRAYDEDSSYGVETALKTQWYNHNGSRTYGPLYYRLSVPLRYFAQSDFLNQKVTVEDLRHKNVHFHLLVLNLFFALGTCILLLRVLTSSWIWVFFGSIPLLSLFFQNHYRSFLLLMAKPDWAVSFFILLAGYVLFESARHQWNDSGIRRIALSWAVASLTKLLTIFFIPSILVYFIWMDAKKWKQNLKYLLRWFCFFYFLLGFPQSWDVPGYVKYLIQQNKHTSLVDFQFLTEKWIPLFVQDLWKPFLFVSLFSIFVPQEPDSTLNKKSVLGICGFSILATLMLVSKKTGVPFEWYTFGFVHLLLLSWIYCLRWFYQSCLSSFRYFYHGYGALMALIGFFFLVPGWISFFPKQLEYHYHQGMNCRAEYFNVSQIVDRAVQGGEYVFVDDHVPFHASASRGFVESAKDHGMNDFLSKKFTWVVLNRNFYQLFYSQNLSDELLESRGVVAAKVYRLFDQQKTVVDPSGRKWDLTYQDPCGFSVWKKMDSK